MEISKKLSNGTLRKLKPKNNTMRKTTCIVKAMFNLIKLTATSVFINSLYHVYKAMSMKKAPISRGFTSSLLTASLDDCTSIF